MAARNGRKPQQADTLAVESMPIDAVIPYVRNPRKNASAPVAKVASSLREFGWRQPIVVDESLTVIAGHTRLLAARSLGMDTVPVHVATGLSKAQIKAYRLADNRTAQESEWDNDLLALEFADLAGEGFDLSLTGFDDDELTALLSATPEANHENGSGPSLGDTEYQIIVTCAGEHGQAQLCEELESRGLKCRMLTL